MLVDNLAPIRSRSQTVFNFSMCCFCDIADSVFFGRILSRIIEGSLPGICQAHELWRMWWCVALSTFWRKLFFKSRIEKLIAFVHSNVQVTTVVSVAVSAKWEIFIEKDAVFGNSWNFIRFIHSNSIVPFLAFFFALPSEFFVRSRLFVVDPGWQFCYASSD